MAKGLETGKGNDNFIPDDDYEYEKQAADEERKKREAAEQKKQEEKEARIRKQREAQKERERQLAKDKLDLMKMKAGIADEDEQIKEEHTEARELHGWEKVANIWYHDKLWIILGACLIGVIVFIIIDTVNKVRPDLEILFVCDNVVQDDETLNLLADMIAEYTPDLNGDGKVKVSIISCPLNPNKYDMLYTANSQKFYANIQLAKMIMVITDSNTDEVVQSAMSSDLPDRLPDNPYIDEKGLSLNFGFLADELNCPDMPNDMHLCLRTPVDSLNDSAEKMQEYYDQDLEILAAFANALSERAAAENDQGLSTEPTPLYSTSAVTAADMSE